MWGTTNKSGAARKAPHANTRTPGSLKVASRKRSRGEGVVGKGYTDVLKRDGITRRPVPNACLPVEVLIEARKRGISVTTYLALAKLDNYLKGN